MTIQVHKGQRLSRLIPKNDHRYALRAALVVESRLVPSGRAMVATNGRAIAFVEVPKDEPLRLVSPEVLTAAERAAKTKIPAGIEWMEDAERLNGAQMPPVEMEARTFREQRRGQSLPDVDRVVPSDGFALSICLDAKALLDLALAINRSGDFQSSVRLRITDSSRPIRVESIQKTNQNVGALMPIAEV